MRIKKTLAPRDRYQRLNTFPDGSVVRLERGFNGCGRFDPFLIVDLQSYSLYLDNGRAAYSTNKIPVVNLATGRFSYIDGDRKAMELVAEVHTS